jgi:hypothetical protein
MDKLALSGMSRNTLALDLQARSVPGKPSCLMHPDLHQKLESIPEPLLKNEQAFSPRLNAGVLCCRLMHAGYTD